MSGCHIPNANINIKQYLHWQALAFMFQGQEPDRALALCQWKMSEISLSTLKSCGAKLRIALSRTKFHCNILFSFCPHSRPPPLYPLHVYVFVICDRWTENFLVLGPIQETVPRQILRPQKASEYRLSSPEWSVHSSTEKLEFQGSLFIIVSKYRVLPVYIV